MNKHKPLVFITGSSGMLGQALIKQLQNQFKTIELRRDSSDPNHPTWNYSDSLNSANGVAPYAVIHLAGAGIADKRWSENYKQTIYDSRINGTQWLVKSINQNKLKPEVFICASAIGYYGHRPHEILDETSVAGSNFVAKVAKDWEMAANELNQSHTRLIKIRSGMILDSSGGALRNMLTPFKLCLGGKLGSGKQYYSWIGLTDATRAIRFLLQNEAAAGVFNLTTENPVSNAEFTQALAKTTKRPAVFHLPKAIVRLAFGEVADELLLADVKVLPNRLTQLGFKFSHPKITPALAAAIR
jgi:hypothetical protein